MHIANNLAELIDQALDLASEQLLEKGKVMPTAYLLSQKGVGVMHLPAEEKKTWNLGIKAMVKGEMASAVAIVEAACIAATEESPALGVSSLDPHASIEQLLVYGVADDERLCKIFILKRTGDTGIELKETDNKSSVESAFELKYLSNIFRPPYSSISH